jgi:transposase-like protein
MICPRCQCDRIEKTYCPRTRKNVWRCRRCGITWSMEDDYGYNDYDDSDSD